jgi:hypothetical protein
MTRRRITTVEEADAADLGWLRKKGTPNAAVNDLADCCAVYRQEISRLRHQFGVPAGSEWQDRVKKK